MAVTTYTDTSHLGGDLGFAEKVISVLEMQKRSKAWLAEELGISKQALNYLLKHSSKPKYVAEIALALDVSPAWLKGKAEEEIDTPVGLEGRKLLLRNMADLNDIKAEVNSDNTYVFVDASQPSESFAVILDNISMEPVFKKGCVLIFDAAKIPKSEDFVLLRRRSNGGVFFRQMIVEGNDIYFKAQDSMYQPIVNEDIEILGVLIETRIVF